MLPSDKEGTDSPSPESNADIGSSASGDRNVIDSSELVGQDGTFKDPPTTEIYTLRVTRNNRLILTK